MLTFELYISMVDNIIPFDYKNLKISLAIFIATIHH